LNSDFSESIVVVVVVVVVVVGLFSKIGVSF
jgi:hypothetical protein